MARPKKYASAAERQAAYRAREAHRLIEVRLPPGVVESLDSIAADTDISRNELVYRLIAFALTSRNWRTFASGYRLPRSNPITWGRDAPGAADEPPANPVPPSSRAKGPRARRLDDDAQAAADLFERFTGHPVSQAQRVALTIPAAGIVVGSCDGVLYTTTRDGQVERYIHRFRKADAPTLVASSDGRQLLLVGGRYRMTELGIVDDSDRKHRHAR
jgi:hypothetical protein